MHYQTYHLELQGLKITKYTRPSAQSTETINGNVVLDANGEAWVELPLSFDTRNRDFRYQLTAIGAPGPSLYVAKEVEDGRFKIAGGTPGTKVSSQLVSVGLAGLDTDALVQQADRSQRQ